MAHERFTKNLWSERTTGSGRAWRPAKTSTIRRTYVIRRILEHREEGVALRRQAVLFRASHHSMTLEAELTGRKIPFHKYGGLKFVETAHVKDMLAFLRLAENPRDWFPARGRCCCCRALAREGRQLMEMLVQPRGDFAVWAEWKPPAAAAAIWPELVKLLADLAATTEDLSVQLHRRAASIRRCWRSATTTPGRACADLEQLEHIAGRYRTRQRMLREMALDPPNSTQDLAGPPHLDDDYLVLSTIHSAKGLEWDAVYVIHAADGNIPSDMATQNAEEIEEERRLFYVALTRAKNSLYVCWPLRYYYASHPGMSDRHGYAQRTRFLPEPVARHFDQRIASALEEGEDSHATLRGGDVSRDVRRGTKDLWS